ncbi:helix-turn-helix domain-containing protein [Streptomyces sp. NPDC059690]|uniref:helix-turn-helix domain-containing protein n=1 Tax=Streptomyces sp. NPDC059690 TaxID=3346907 RepID=UPI0036BF2480
MTSPSASPEHTRLAQGLRELRTRTGLSLAALAAKTAYSKSSWERYLNAKALPPREAVEELCRLAGQPRGRYLALWEIAESEWRGRAGEAPAPPAADTPADALTPVPPTATGHRGVAAVALLASACALVVGGVAVAVFLLLPHPDGAHRTAALPATPTGPHCRGAACEGKDPMRMNCANAPDTLATHHTATGAWLELRGSEECGASWGRMWGTRIGDRMEVTVGGRIRRAEVRDDVDAASYVYTPMAVTRPGSVVHACFRPADGGRSECFDGRVAGGGGR